MEYVVSPLLGYEDHWDRDEWQRRGSGHDHGLLWIPDAPPMDQETEESCRTFAGYWGEKITAHNPDPSRPPDARNPASLVPADMANMLQAMATVARYPLLWPDKLSAAISILTELPNTLAKYLSTYKSCPCICSAKTPIHPCISPAATLVTGFTLQPSYSNPCHWSCYYRSCRHKSSSPYDDSYYYYGSGQLCDYFCRYNTS